MICVQHFLSVSHREKNENTAGLHLNGCRLFCITARRDLDNLGRVANHVGVSEKNDYDESMKHQVSTSALRLTAISAVVLLLVGIAGHFIQAAGSPSSTAAGGGSLRQPQANGNGLVGWWKLDGDVKDATVNASDGSLSNFTFDGLTNGWVKGKYGNSLLFNGSNTKVTANPSFPIATGSVSLWINPNYVVPSGGGNSLFSENNNTFGLYYNSPGFSSTNLDFWGGGNDTAGSAKPSIGIWNHIVITWSASTKQIYLNNTLVGSSTGSFTYAFTSPLNIGGQWTGNSTIKTINGSLDDVRIYNRALSATEVTALYQGSNPANCDQTCSSYLKFDENGGTTALNSLHGVSTANNNNGTLINSPTWVAGKYGNSLLFNGSNNYVNIPYSSSFSFSSYTLSAWIKTSNAGSGRRRIITYQPSDPTYLLMSLNNNVLEFGDSPSGTLSTNGSLLNDNTWHLVTVTKQAGVSLTWYVDGAQVGYKSSSDSTVQNYSTSIQIGTQISHGEYFAGSIDDTRIYNTALTSAQVSSLYSSQSTNVDTTNLVAYYNLDSSSGTTAYDISTSVPIATLNNFNFTSTSGWTSGVFGSGLLLDGVDDYISLPDQTMTSGTVEFWINPTTITGDQRLFSQASGLSTQSGMLALNQSSGESGSLWVWDGTAWQRLADTGTIGAGFWNHIMVGYNGASVTAYVNGVQTYTVISGCAFSGVPISIGGKSFGSAGNTYSGMLDDFRIYKRFLAPEEAAEHYRLGL